MNLGLAALYPRIVLHFKFPGIRKGEKTRNLFQFIFSTSRGFGFPIYFGPEFYNYSLNKIKYIEPFFKWVYTVNHRANQAIFLVDKRIKSKRHHPGEFESVIISEYKNNVFKGINTLFHGFYTGGSKNLGKFKSLEEALQNIFFSYTIGDHAMSINKIPLEGKYTSILEIPLKKHDFIVQKYEIDFYLYIKKLMDVNNSLIKRVVYYQNRKKNLLKEFNSINKLKINLRKVIPIKIVSKDFNEINKYEKYIDLIKNLKELLWTTPLFTHTVYVPTNNISKNKFLEEWESDDDYDQDSTDSILLTTIRRYEKIQNIRFEDDTIIAEIKDLRDSMAKMWLFFKEKHFRYAVKKLDEITKLSVDDKAYSQKVNDYIDKLIPILSIYEIFNRPLVESVYPESSPNIHRIGRYLARIFTSKFNPIGVNLINIFNKLAFYNWIYLMKTQKLKYKEFFALVLKLPIWNHIPLNVKEKILSYD
jgi:hypothetical protein